MREMVDLNSDLGEGYGAYKMGMDGDILQYVTSANVACGFHAGDPLIMDRTVRLALQNDAMVGAHPGYPDLLGFGRRNMDITKDEAKAYMLYQLGALHAFAKANGTSLQHVKLHGAFYNTTSVNEELAEGIIEGILDYDKEIILLALSGCPLARLAESRGLKVAHEVFADRGYNSDGTLVSRNLPGAMIHNESIALNRTKRMVLHGEVETVNGTIIPIKADSICVHGDNPKAVEFVKFIRENLENEGVQIKPLSSF
ncbi:MAG: LamB/YcsF family protein, partial [Bacillota bacterium]